jgi:hypothetical protein
MKSAGGSSTGSEIQATPQGCAPRNAGAPDAPARLPIARDPSPHRKRVSGVVLVLVMLLLFVKQLRRGRLRVRARDRFRGPRNA